MAHGTEGRCTATIVFTGTIDPDAFAAFVTLRARLLDLAAAIAQSQPDRMTITVTGQPDLIDAFEMACSLGPRCCVVRHVARIA